MSGQANTSRAGRDERQSRDSREAARRRRGTVGKWRGWRGKVCGMKWEMNLSTVRRSQLGGQQIKYCGNKLMLDLLLTMSITNTWKKRRSYSCISLQRRERKKKNMVEFSGWFKVMIMKFKLLMSTASHSNSGEQTVQIVNCKTLLIVMLQKK